MGGPAIDVEPGFTDSASQPSSGLRAGLSRLVLLKGGSRAGKPELHLVLRVWKDAERRTEILAAHRGGVVAYVYCPGQFD